ncbi:hypothetical protein Ancab_036584 [Ancistrocladus abbreviatus]
MPWPRENFRCTPTLNAPLCGDERQSVKILIWEDVPCGLSPVVRVVSFACHASIVYGLDLILQALLIRWHCALDCSSYVLALELFLGKWVLYKSIKLSRLKSLFFQFKPKILRKFVLKTIFEHFSGHC